MPCLPVLQHKKYLAVILTLIFGAMTLHGPHQVAKKSTTTSLSLFSLNFFGKSSWKERSDALDGFTEWQFKQSTLIKLFFEMYCKEEQRWCGPQRCHILVEMKFHVFSLSGCVTRFSWCYLILGGWGGWYWEEFLGFNLHRAQSGVIFWVGGWSQEKFFNLNLYQAKSSLMSFSGGGGEGDTSTQTCPVNPHHRSRLYIHSQDPPNISYCSDFTVWHEPVDNSSKSSWPQGVYHLNC